MYGKTRRVSYGQQGPKCCLQLAQNIGWGFKTQEPQDEIVYTVPNCRPNCLVKGNFGRDHPPILEREKSLHANAIEFQPLAGKPTNKKMWKKIITSQNW